MVRTLRNSDALKPYLVSHRRRPAGGHTGTWSIGCDVDSCGADLWKGRRVKPPVPREVDAGDGGGERELQRSCRRGKGVVEAEEGSREVEGRLVDG